MFGTAQNESAAESCILESGDLIFTGVSRGQLSSVPVRIAHTNPGTDFDFYVAGYRPDQGMQWITYLGATASLDSVYGIAVDKAGQQILVSGTTATDPGALGGLAPRSPHAGGNDFAVFSLNFDGTLRWFTFLGTSGGETTPGVTFDPFENAVYVAGRFATGSATADGVTARFAPQGGSECALYRLNSGGEIEWFTYISGPADDRCQALTVNDYGGPLVTGGADAELGNLAPINPFSTAEDVFVASFTPQGDPLWVTHLGSAAAEAEYGKEIVRLDGGDFVLGALSYTGLSSVNGRAPLIPFAGADGNEDVLLAKYSK